MKLKIVAAIPKADWKTKLERNLKKQEQIKKGLININGEKLVNGLTLEEFRQTLPETDRYEVFSFMHVAFNIPKALWLAQKMKLQSLSADEVQAMASSCGLGYPKGELKVNMWNGVEERDILARWNEINLAKPILIAAFKTSNLIIDGNHRLRKAFLEKSSLKYYHFSATQTKQIME